MSIFLKQFIDYKQYELTTSFSYRINNIKPKIDLSGTSHITN